MKTKIAVFGREETINRISRCVSDHENIQLLPFVYANAEEADRLVDKAVMCDIYLFTNPIAYLFAKEKVEKKRLPAVQANFDEFMVSAAFYQLKKEHKFALTRFSLDIPSRKQVDEVRSEFSMDKQEMYVYSYGDDRPDLNEVVAFHTRHWNNGDIECVLTSSGEVEQALKERNIPVHAMQIPGANLEKAVEQAKSIAILNQSSSVQVVAGYVRLKNLHAVISEKGRRHVDDLLLQLQKIAQDYARKTQAAVLPTKDNAFVLIGTKRFLDHITNNYRNFPLLLEMEQALNMPVDIGFGLGLTAMHAEHHAKLALEACAKSDISSCYIVNERRDTIGPIGVKKPFDTSKLYHALIHKARLNNELSYNFLDFISIRNNEPFSSQDLANYYGVTKRSAERTIGKLVAGDVIIAVGEEKPYLRGRPRKLFQIEQS